MYYDFYTMNDYFQMKIFTLLNQRLLIRVHKKSKNRNVIAMNRPNGKRLYKARSCKQEMPPTRGREGKCFFAPGIKSSKANN